MDTKRPERNFVKKHMDKFNRPETHRDRSKYKRKEKYKNYLDYDEDEWGVDDERENYEEWLAQERESNSRAEMRHFMDTLGDDDDSYS